MLSDLASVHREIGIALIQQDLGARKPSDQEAVERGRRWLEVYKKRICDIIRSEVAQRALKGSGGAVEEQIRLLVDVIAAATLNVPPNAVAKAVIILGESWFCK
jgi:hypothetical protein